MEGTGRALAVGPVTVPAGGTKVGWPLWVSALVWLGFPLFGAGAGLLVLLAADRLDDVPFAPVRIPAGWLAEADAGWLPLAAAGVGALAGLALAWQAVADELVVGVGPTEVTLVRGATGRTVPRGDVAAVFLDAGRLVLLGRHGEELAREKQDGDRATLAAAFTEHGYPWRDDGDPYAAAFRRWVEGADGLPPGADAVLRARQRALEKRDGGDAEDLRRELTRIGVVVREEGEKQYWRPVRS